MSEHPTLRNVLADLWDANVLEMPSNDESMDERVSADHPLIALDSLTAVEVLIEVESVVGAALPIEKIVRQGGYSSKEQFIDEVTAAVEEFMSART